MFDLGWTELLLIGIVALIVVGPKELPMLFQTVGRFVGKARAMAREFTQAMNDAADESGMGDITKTMRDIADPRAFATDSLREATDWSPPARSDKEVREEAKERLANQTAQGASDQAKAEARAAELAASADALEAEARAHDGPPKVAAALESPAPPPKTPAAGSEEPS